MRNLAALSIERPSPLVRGEKVPKADEGFVFPPEAILSDMGTAAMVVALP